MGRAPGNMDPRTRALVSPASVRAVVALVGYLLRLIFDWPSRLVLGAAASIVPSLLGRALLGRLRGAREGTSVREISP